MAIYWIPKNRHNSFWTKSQCPVYTRRAGDTLYLSTVDRRLFFARLDKSFRSMSELCVEIIVPVWCARTIVSCSTVDSYLSNSSFLIIKLIGIKILWLLYRPKTTMYDINGHTRRRPNSYERMVRQQNRQIVRINKVNVYNICDAIDRLYA